MHWFTYLLICLLSLCLPLNSALAKPTLKLDARVEDKSDAATFTYTVGNPSSNNTNGSKEILLIFGLQFPGPFQITDVTGPEGWDAQYQQVAGTTITWVASDADKMIQPGEKKSFSFTIKKTSDYMSGPATVASASFINLSEQKPDDVILEVIGPATEAQVRANRVMSAKPNAH
jgi:hypothetical protein